MPIIEWRDAFSIGHPELDEQHKIWLSIYNKAHDRMMDPNGMNLDSTGIDALKEMKTYGEHHFAMEEAYMKKIRYPETEAHTAMHEDFSKQVKAMINDLESEVHVLNSEIIKKIENWLIHHILTEDKKIKAYAQSTGSSGA